MTPILPMPVIVGAPRSGTTLLRFMLDAHPELAIPPETGFLMLAGTLSEAPASPRQFFEAVTAFPADAPAWDDFGISRDRFWSRLRAIVPFTIADGYRTFYRAYAERFGKRRWGDKTPIYSQHLTTIDHLLPEAHFVHVIRDGRDVALSLRQTWFSPGDSVEILAEHWRADVLTARRQGAGCRDYVEVRFEDLIRDTRTVLQRLCRFLNLPFTDAMLRYADGVPARLAEHGDRRRTDGSLVVSHAGRVQQQVLTMQPPQLSRIQAWRTAMDSDERIRFEAIAGDLLRELDYDEPAAL